MLLGFTQPLTTFTKLIALKKGTPFNMEALMNRTLFAAVGVALAATCGLASAASWSVFVEPGVYGRVAIGGYAEPPAVYAPQPVMAVDNGYGQIVEEVIDPAYATDQPPVYLWVPDYQRQHWAQYSREYGAVGVPVYFVDDGWYRANVMRRNWTPEQRSWTQQQWLEQDRLARDRFERQRFEQQRYEQQQRWSAQREWYSQQQQQQTHLNHNRIGGRPAGQTDANWGGASQGNPAPRPQPGGGQWPGAGGAWQQGGNGGRPTGALPGNGANAGNAANVGNAGQQPPAASQPRGWGGNAAQNAGDRRGNERGEERGQHDERRGQSERHGAFERGRSGGGNRER